MRRLIIDHDHYPPVEYLDNPDIEEDGGEPEDSNRYEGKCKVNLI